VLSINSLSKAGFFINSRRLHSKLMKKTLFLDVDGVLHGMRHDQGGRWIVGAPLNKIEILAQCLEVHDHSRLDIVISSTWRFDGLNAVRQKMPRLSQWIRDCTDLSLNDNRYVEIITYVHKNQIQDWRALDDDISPFSDHPNLIACDEKTGIQEEQLQAIENWLEDIAPSDRLR
jgi:hypothetical protein